MSESRYDVSKLKIASQMAAPTKSSVATASEPRQTERIPAARWSKATARENFFHTALLLVQTMAAQLDIPPRIPRSACSAKKSGGHTRYRRGTHPIQPPSSTLVGREVLDDWCGDGVHAWRPGPEALTAPGPSPIVAASKPTTGVAYGK